MCAMPHFDDEKERLAFEQLREKEAEALAQILAERYDFPYVDLGKALSSFEKLEMKESVKEKILISNAKALFGI